LQYKVKELIQLSKYNSVASTSK